MLLSIFLKPPDLNDKKIIFEEKRSGRLPIFLKKKATSFSNTPYGKSLTWVGPNDDKGGRHIGVQHFWKCNIRPTVDTPKIAIHMYVHKLPQNRCIVRTVDQDELC